MNLMIRLLGTLELSVDGREVLAGLALEAERSCR
jgi:hypothetical protein